MIGQTPDVTIGVIAGSEELQLFGVFGAMRLTDGTIVLVDQGSRQIRFYDQSGAFLRAAGRAGEGPGEFRNAFYLWRTGGDTIWVGDYRPWRFNVFTSDGTFVRTVTPEPRYLNSPAIVAVLADGRSVLVARHSLEGASVDFRLREASMVLHAADGELLDTIGRYANGRWGMVEDDPQAMVLVPHFESFLRADARGTAVAIGHGSQPELMIWDLRQAPRLSKIIRWDGGNRRISQADVDAENQALIDRFSGMDSGARRRVVEQYVSERRPVADQFPAFSDVRIGTDGRFWIKEYRRPGARPGSSWRAFNSDGSFSCAVVFPEFPEILEFGEDYVLVKHANELDVEEVWQLPLSPPGSEAQ